MKFFLTILISALSISNLQAQLLKKLKQKAEEVAGKVKDKPSEKKEDNSATVEKRNRKNTNHRCPV